MAWLEPQLCRAIFALTSLSDALSMGVDWPQLGNTPAGGGGKMVPGEHQLAATERLLTH